MVTRRDGSRGEEGRKKYEGRRRDGMRMRMRNE